MPDTITTKFTVDTLRAHARGEVIDFVCVNVINHVYTYLNAAKGIIVLGDTDATRDDLKAALVARGFSADKAKNLVKNARPAVDAWANLIEPGYADETWFDRCTRDDFIVINRAVAALRERKTSLQLLVDEGYFKMSPASAYGKFELVAERGLTQAQHEAAKADAAEAAFDAAAPGKPGAPTTPAAEASETKAKAPTKSVRPATEVLEEKIAAAEKSALELLSVTDEVTAQRILTRLASLKVAADAVVAKRFSVKAPAEQLVGAA
jgi:hypothetical protein